MTDWLDTDFTTNLLRRLAAGKRLAQAQLEHLEDNELITYTNGAPWITPRGTHLLNERTTHNAHQ